MERGSKKDVPLTREQKVHVPQNVKREQAPAPRRWSE